MRLKSWACLFFILLLFFSCQKPGQELAGQKPEAEKNTESPAIDLKPFLKNGQSKWKILVVQSGEYYSYLDTFKSILNAFRNEGWLKDAPIPQEKSQTMKDLLAYLRSNSLSDYLEFSPDLLVDFDWNDAQAKSEKWAEPFRKNPADLIIALGTLAGQVTSSLKNWKTPVLVDSVSDPIGSEICVSNQDSGKDFLTVRTDPESYLRQIRLFYDVVQFKKLGVIYTDTVVGRGYAALSDIEAVAKEKGFEIIRNTHALEDPPEDKIPQAEAQYLKALEELCPKVDAIYLTIQAGLTESNIAKIMEIVDRYRIPSFAMEGSMYVKKGVLFGVSDNELLSTGIYNLKKIVQIFQGIKPRNLNQIFEHSPHIAINLKVADLIGYDIPVDIISSSDEIYTTIE